MSVSFLLITVKRLMNICGIKRNPINTCVCTVTSSKKTLHRYSRVNVLHEIKLVFSALIGIQLIKLLRPSVFIKNS